MQSNGTNGGSIKLVALQGTTIVGEQTYRLGDRAGTLTYTGTQPFDRLQVMAGDPTTQFTLRSAEFETTFTQSSDLPTYLSVPSSHLLSTPSSTGSTYTYTLPSTTTYNSALTATFHLDPMQPIPPDSTVKVIARRNGILVGEQTYSLSDPAAALQFRSNQAFDQLQIVSSSSLNLSTLQVEAVHSEAPRTASLKLIQSANTPLQVYENEVFVEQVTVAQNGSVPTLERLSITTLDSADTRAFQDRTFYDRGEGISVTDGDDGSSGLRKRIDGDEVLQVKLQPTAHYSSAISALISIDRLTSLSTGAAGGQVKVLAMQGETIVEEQTYHMETLSGLLTYSSDQPFDSLRLTAGNSDSQFTLKSFEFTVLTH